MIARKSENIDCCNTLIQQSLDDARIIPDASASETRPLYVGPPILATLTDTFSVYADTTPRRSHVSLDTKSEIDYRFLIRLLRSVHETNAFSLLEKIPAELQQLLASELECAEVEASLRHLQATLGCTIALDGSIAALEHTQNTPLLSQDPSLSNTALGGPNAPSVLRLSPSHGSVIDAAREHAGELARQSHQVLLRMLSSLVQKYAALTRNGWEQLCGDLASSRGVPLSPINTHGAPLPYTSCSISSIPSPYAPLPDPLQSMGTGESSIPPSESATRTADTSDTPGSCTAPLSEERLADAVGQMWASVLEADQPPQHSPVLDTPSTPQPTHTQYILGNMSSSTPPGDMPSTSPDTLQCVLARAWVEGPWPRAETQDEDDDELRVGTLAHLPAAPRQPLDRLANDVSGVPASSTDIRSSDDTAMSGKAVITETRNTAEEHVHEHVPLKVFIAGDNMVTPYHMGLQLLRAESRRRRTLSLHSGTDGVRVDVGEQKSVDVAEKRSVEVSEQPAEQHGANGEAPSRLLLDTASRSAADADLGRSPIDDVVGGANLNNSEVTGSSSGLNSVTSTSSRNTSTPTSMQANTTSTQQPSPQTATAQQSSVQKAALQRQSARGAMTQRSRRLRPTHPALLALAETCLPAEVPVQTVEVTVHRPSSNSMSGLATSASGSSSSVEISVLPTFSSDTVLTSVSTVDTTSVRVRAALPPMNIADAMRQCALPGVAVLARAVGPCGVLSRELAASAAEDVVVQSMAAHAPGDNIDDATVSPDVRMEASIAGTKATVLGAAEQGEQSMYGTDVVGSDAATPASPPSQHPVAIGLANAPVADAPSASASRILLPITRSLTGTATLAPAAVDRARLRRWRAEQALLHAGLLKELQSLKARVEARLAACTARYDAVYAESERVQLRDKQGHAYLHTLQMLYGKASFPRAGQQSKDVYCLAQGYTREDVKAPATSRITRLDQSSTSPSDAEPPSLPAPQPVRTSSTGDAATTLPINAHVRGLDVSTTLAAPGFTSALSLPNLLSAASEDDGPTPLPLIPRACSITNHAVGHNAIYHTVQRPPSGRLTRASSKTTPVLGPMSTSCSQASLPRSSASSISLLPARDLTSAVPTVPVSRRPLLRPTNMWGPIDTRPLPAPVTSEQSPDVQVTGGEGASLSASLDADMMMVTPSTPAISPTAGADAATTPSPHAHIHTQTVSSSSSSPDDTHFSPPYSTFTQSSPNTVPRSRAESITRADVEAAVAAANAASNSRPPPIPQLRTSAHAPAVVFLTHPVVLPAAPVKELDRRGRTRALRPGNGSTDTETDSGGASVRGFNGAGTGMLLSSSSGQSRTASMIGLTTHAAGGDVLRTNTARSTTGQISRRMSRRVSTHMAAAHPQSSHDHAEVAASHRATASSPEAVPSRLNSPSPMPQRLSTPAPGTSTSGSETLSNTDVGTMGPDAAEVSPNAAITRQIVALITPATLRTFSTVDNVLRATTHARELAQRQQRRKVGGSSSSASSLTSAGATGKTRANTKGKAAVANAVPATTRVTRIGAWRKPPPPTPPPPEPSYMAAGACVLAVAQPLLQDALARKATVVHVKSKSDEPTPVIGAGITGAKAAPLSARADNDTAGKALQETSSRAPPATANTRDGDDQDCGNLANDAPNASTMGLNARGKSPVKPLRVARAAIRLLGTPQPFSPADATPLSPEAVHRADAISRGLMSPSAPPPRVFMAKDGDEAVMKPGVSVRIKSTIITHQRGARRPQVTVTVTPALATGDTLLAGTTVVSANDAYDPSARTVAVRVGSNDVVRERPVPKSLLGGHTPQPTERRNPPLLRRARTTTALQRVRTSKTVQSGPPPVVSKSTISSRYDDTPLPAQTTISAVALPHVQAPPGVLVPDMVAGDEVSLRRAMGTTIGNERRRRLGLLNTAVEDAKACVTIMENVALRSQRRGSHSFPHTMAELVKGFTSSATTHAHTHTNAHANLASSSLEGLPPADTVHMPGDSSRAHPSTDARVQASTLRRASTQHSLVLPSLSPLHRPASLSMAGATNAPSRTSTLHLSEHALASGRRGSEVTGQAAETGEIVVSVPPPVPLHVYARRKNPFYCRTNDRRRVPALSRTLTGTVVMHDMLLPVNATSVAEVPSARQTVSAKTMAEGIGAASSSSSSQTLSRAATAPSHVLPHIEPHSSSSRAGPTVTALKCTGAVKDGVGEVADAIGVTVLHSDTRTLAIPLPEAFLTPVPPREHNPLLAGGRNYHVLTHGADLPQRKTRTKSQATVARAETGGLGANGRSATALLSSRFPAATASDAIDTTKTSPRATVLPTLSTHTIPPLLAPEMYSTTHSTASSTLPTTSSPSSPAKLSHSGPTSTNTLTASTSTSTVSAALSTAQRMDALRLEQARQLRLQNVALKLEMADATGFGENGTSFPPGSLRQRLAALLRQADADSAVTYCPTKPSDEACDGVGGNSKGDNVPALPSFITLLSHPCAAAALEQLPLPVLGSPVYSKRRPFAVLSPPSTRVRTSAEVDASMRAAVRSEDIAVNAPVDDPEAAEALRKIGGSSMRYVSEAYKHWPTGIDIKEDFGV